MGVYGILGAKLPKDEVQVGVCPKLFVGSCELKNINDGGGVRLMVV